MKTLRNALLSLVVVLALLLPDAAQGYYHPGKGRWLSRDPVRESHFRASSAQESQTSQSGIASTLFVGNDCLHCFVAGDAVNAVDYLGLKVTSATCSDKVVQQVEAGLTRMCALALAPKLGCCDVVPERKKKLKKICNASFHVILRCQDVGDSECATGTCAYTLPNDDFEENGIIFLCPVMLQQENPCGTTFDCILLHEMLHGAGLKGDPNMYIQMIEKCVGCKESYKEDG